MKVFVVAILAIFCAASINAKPSRLTHIENGEIAERNEYSVIVLALARVTDQRATFGGGSIISRRHILTAAHLCVNAKQFRIGYGHVRAREVVRLAATSALIHSHFNSKTLENDLAIITLPQNQLINMQIVTPMRITRREVQINDPGTVASFGFENNTATTISENLMVARQAVINNQACAEAFNRPVHANQFCGHDARNAPPPPEEEPTPPEDEPSPPEDEPSPPEEEPTPPEEEPSPPEDDDEGSSEDDPPSEDSQSWSNGWSRRSMNRVATNDRRRTAVCRGDTGSAIVRRTEQGIIGFGIVSRVPQGCNAERPALYTLLPAFVQWIEDATLGEVQIVNL